ncbi:MAG: IS1182 family transposase [Nitrospirae bacterium]|nr:IS1182 family transposase [Nitrospirota bacterium]
MPGRTFRPHDQDQIFLLPPSLRDWLPADHLSYFVADLVEELDLHPLLKTYGDLTRGTVPYDPRMLVAVLLYAYAVGVPASRQIARRLHEDIAFRVLTANTTPDFRTISDFRKQHLAALRGLFVQVLRLCQQAGLVKLGHIALDGTKLKANASKHKAMSYERMVKEEGRLQAEVDGLLQQATEADARDDARYGTDRTGDELPEELAFREGRLRKIREAKAALEPEAREAAAAKQTANEAREAEGPRPGPRPQPPSAVPAPKAQRNFTDPESRIMPSSSDKGSFVPGYNGQAVVDTTAQILIAADVTHATNAKQQAQPLLQQAIAKTGQVPTIASLDASYYSDENVQALTAWGCTPLIPPDRQTHERTRPAAPHGRIPLRLSVANRMRRTLPTKRGRRLYAKRRVTVEPVFGQIKQGRGFRQFLLRGHDQVRGEWALICTTHNVLKLWMTTHRCRLSP